LLCFRGRATTRYAASMNSLSPSSLPALPRASAWPLVRALFKRPARASAQPIQASYRLDRLDADHVRRYSDAFGFPPGPVPLTYLYLLAQRAQLATMLDRAIPFRIVGLIHVANSLTMHSAVRLEAALTLVTTLSMPEPLPNGAVECLLETKSTDGEQLVFTCTSRYLIKRGQRTKRTAPSPIVAPMGKADEQWVVQADAGRRYAALSGDWNPIHLWAWSARLMGMKQPIIHGMHTVAMACSLRQQSTGRVPVTIDCHFRSTVPLRSKVSLSDAGNPGVFTVICKQRVAVEGIISFI
jgi:acyl dehydratase